MFKLYSLLSRAATACVLPVLLAACTAPLPSNRPASLGHRFALAVGGQAIADYDTQIKLNSGDGQFGTDIDFEEVLGFNKTSDFFRADAEWRLAARHGLALSFFQIDRNANRTIDREIEFGETTFPINASLSTDVGVTVAKLAYRYYLLVRDRWELGASLGVHTLDLDVSLNAQTLSQNESADVLAPLPVAGLHGAWSPGERTRISVVGEVFALEYEGSSGTLVDTRVTLEQDLTRHLGVGIGYNGFLVDVDIERQRFNGGLDWSYQGLMVYLRLLF